MDQVRPLLPGAVRRLQRTRYGRYAPLGAAGLMVLLVAANKGPAYLEQVAMKGSCELVVHCSSKVGVGRVVDCSLGPHVFAQGMFAWLLAEHGCTVLALDVGHKRRVYDHPARGLVPSGPCAGALSFLVSSSHSLLPTDTVLHADWFTALSTLEFLPEEAAVSVLTQASTVCGNMLLTCRSGEASVEASAAWWATPPRWRDAACSLDAVVRRVPGVELVEKYAVGGYDCYVLRSRAARNAQLFGAAEL